MSDGCSVLIVDDDVDSFDVLRILLEHNQHTVTGAPDADVAMNLLLAQSFDLAIIDLKLPETDGWRLLEKMREHEQLEAVRAIALTAYYTPVVSLRAREAGFEDCLSKPVTNPILKRILKHLKQ